MHFYEPEYFARPDGTFYPAILRLEIKQDGRRDINLILTKVFTPCTDCEQATSIARTDFQAVEQYYEEIDIDLDAAELMLQHFMRQGYFPLSEQQPQTAKRSTVVAGA